MPGAVGCNIKSHKSVPQSVAMERRKKTQTQKQLHDSAPGDEKQKKQRYNESEAMQAFLSSERGIVFLIDRAKEAKIQTATVHGQRRDTGYIVDEVLDFYAAWSFGCPIRHNNKLSQYELVKKIEDYCCKPEVKRFFDYLFLE